MEQFLANGLCDGAIFALMALGFSLIYYGAGVFHVAHGATFVTAGFSAYATVVRFHLPVFPSVLISLAAAVLLGLAFELFVYRPLENRKATILVVLISSLGAYIVVSNSLALVFGNAPQVLTSGAGQTFKVGSARITAIQVWEIITAIACTVCYAIFLYKTRTGRLLRGLSDHQLLASVLGANTSALRLLVFAVGSLFAGIAGVLVAFDTGIDPSSGMPIVLTAAVACLIAGTGRLLAGSLGALLIGILQSLVVMLSSSAWKPAVTFTLLVGFLLLRPQGILGVVGRLEER